MRLLLGLLIVMGAAITLVSPVPSATAPHPAARGQASMDEPLHRQIDEWIARNGLNPYGDPPGTMYAGSTPLFDERTGVVKDRYGYILEHHPELKDDGTRKR